MLRQRNRPEPETAGPLNPTEACRACEKRPGLERARAAASVRAGKSESVSNRRHRRIGRRPRSIQKLLFADTGGYRHGVRARSAPLARPQEHAGGIARQDHGDGRHRGQGRQPGKAELRFRHSSRRNDDDPRWHSKDRSAGASARSAPADRHVLSFARRRPGGERGLHNIVGHRQRWREGAGGGEGAWRADARPGGIRQSCFARTTC